MFMVRYPSLVTPGRLVYAEGAGSAEDPAPCEFVLPQTGSYLLYVNYTRVFGETGITLSPETSHPCLPGEWFALRNQSDQSAASFTLEGVAGVENQPGTETTYRIFLSPFSNLALAASEDRLRISVVAGGTPGGSVILRLVSASRPSEIPHMVPGFEQIKTGSLQVNLTEDGGLGGWKLAHETEYRIGGETLGGLGAGKQLVVFKEVNGFAPDPVFADVPVNSSAVVDGVYQ